MQHLILLVTAFIAFLILDAIWLGGLMKNFYFENLEPIVRKENGQLSPNWTSAIGVYILIALGLVYFVLPQAQSLTYLQTFLLGAVFGLVLYGVYDLTNHATLAKFPLQLALVDIAWGSFACGITSALLKWVQTLI